MKVIHVVSSIDKSSGGPARSVTDLVRFVAKKDLNNKIYLLTLASKHPIVSHFEEENVTLLFFDNIRLLVKALKKVLVTKDKSLIHVHGIWQNIPRTICKFARKSKIPYIITPRGMLEPWSLEQKRYKKKLALFLYQRKDLIKAACIHATATMEAENVNRLGLNSNIVVIPNGINLGNFKKEVPTKSSNPKQILFLSRIHKKKGLENLIEAWGLLKKDFRTNWVINIVGNGNEQYIDSLKQQISKKGISKEIFIYPPVYGLEKNNLFRSSNIFILPTYSENFGIVVAEALASFTPVITTKGTPWEDLLDRQCGDWIDVGIIPLKESLINMMSYKPDELLEMGVRGRKLIQDTYSMKTVAKKMLNVYANILN